MQDSSPRFSAAESGSTSRTSKSASQLSKGRARLLHDPTLPFAFFSWAVLGRGQHARLGGVRQRPAGQLSCLLRSLTSMLRTPGHHASPTAHRPRGWRDAGSMPDFADTALKVVRPRCSHPRSTGLARPPSHHPDLPPLVPPDPMERYQTFPNWLSKRASRGVRF